MSLILLSTWYFFYPQSQDILIIRTFLLEHSFMLKSYGVGGVVVAHKTLVSAPVPIGIKIRGLGLGLDNILVFLLFSFLSVIVTNKSNIHTHPF